MDYPYLEPFIQSVSIEISCYFIVISLYLLGFSFITDRFADMKVHKPESKAFAQMFQKNYAGKILGCHLQLLNVIRSGGYLPDRVINLILQYLTNRFVGDFLCSNMMYSQRTNKLS